MDLDHYLLDQILDELSNTYQLDITTKVEEQLLREQSEALIGLMLSLSETKQWGLISEGILDHPVICIRCLCSNCIHISTHYDPDADLGSSPSSIRSLWTEKDLANFALDVEVQSLQFGTFN